MARSAEKQQRRLFEGALDPLNKLGRLPAIDDAVIEGGGEIHHLADRDLPVTHDRALGDAVDADDRDLRIIDDRRRGETAERAETRHRDGRARYLLAAGLAAARDFGEAGNLCRGLPQ